MLKQGEQYSAEDFIALKEKVKAEMLRRCHTGSLEVYGGESYDFVMTPAKGLQILADQANKIIEPINAVNDSGISIQKVGDPAMAMNALDAKIMVYSVAPTEGTEHYCRESCSGLCYTSCSSGCTDECTSGCGSVCSSSCTGTCTGTCSGTCSSSCTDTCISGCAWHCTNGCGGTCTGCTGGCTGNCTNTCSGSSSGIQGGGNQEPGS